jgi:hypothetical protein
MAKKTRSKAQKAATAKLVALNKKRGGKKSGKKSGKKASKKLHHLGTLKGVSVLAKVVG